MVVVACSSDVKICISHLQAFFFFVSGDQLACTNSTLKARIRPQWLSRLRQLWMSVPWHVCELVPLLGSCTMPGQHSQPTPTSTAQQTKTTSCKALNSLMKQSATSLWCKCFCHQQLDGLRLIITWSHFFLLMWVTKYITSTKFFFSSTTTRTCCQVC